MYEHFRFGTMKEAWDFFTKAARLHFAKLIRNMAQKNPDIRREIKKLKYYDYCARLMYILAMWAKEGKKSSEFGLEWAMLMAKPLSADQARRSINDLVNLGLMGKQYGKKKKKDSGIDWRNDPRNERPPRRNIDRPSERKKKPPESGGDANYRTRFPFD